MVGMSQFQSSITGSPRTTASTICILSSFRTICILSSFRW